jgi:predicted nuclease of predicted toxin-antitoxin system
LTHDLDFPRLLAVSDATEPSVIVFRLSDMRSQSVMTHLLAALDHFEAELGQGAVVSVADKTMRCHLLPILRRH